VFVIIIMVDKTEIAPDCVKEIETLCRRHIKSKTLTDDAYSYMSRLILEDCPRNATELFNLIEDFLTDGMQYNEDEAFKICDILSKIFIEKKLIVIIQRDTIVAEKLSSTVTLSQMQLKSNAVKEGDFIDPLLGMERGKANYNSQFNKGKLADVIKKSKNKEADALDKKIMEFMEHKNKVPHQKFATINHNHLKQTL